MKIENLPHNEHVKRAIEIAAAGKHSIQFIGRHNGMAKLFHEFVYNELEDYGIWPRYMTPCPCGNYYQEGLACYCSRDAIIKHRRDYMPASFDISITVDELDADKIIQWLSRERNGKRRLYETWKDIRKRIDNMSSYDDLALGVTETSLLRAAISHAQLTYPQVVTTISVARTIANLHGSERIQTQHVAEAIQYRDPLADFGRITND